MIVSPYLKYLFFSLIVAGCMSKTFTKRQWCFCSWQTSLIAMPTDGNCEIVLYTTCISVCKLKCFILCVDSCQPYNKAWFDRVSTLLHNYPCVLSLYYYTCHKKITEGASVRFFCQSLAMWHAVVDLAWPVSTMHPLVYVIICIR